MNPDMGIAVGADGTILHIVGGSVQVPISVTPTAEFILQNNYPNPFNPITIIQYQIPEVGLVSLQVFDILGNEVATLVNEEKPGGTYEVQFDASNLSSGVYFYRLRAGSFTEIKKMVLLR
jgi:hypothetical protein